NHAETVGGNRSQPCVLPRLLPIYRFLTLIASSGRPRASRHLAHAAYRSFKGWALSALSNNSTASTLSNNSTAFWQFDLASSGGCPVIKLNNLLATSKYTVPRFLMAGQFVGSS